MAATVYSLFTFTDLAPGETVAFVWKNLPAGQAYALDARPFYAGSYYEGYNSTTEVEITRVWRRTRSIEKPGSIGVTVEVHNDILAHIKNVGGHKLDCNVSLVVFS
jgi:hypothetical protein